MQNTLTPSPGPLKFHSFICSKLRISSSKSGPGVDNEPQVYFLEYGCLSTVLDLKICEQKTQAICPKQIRHTMLGQAYYSHL